MDAKIKDEIYKAVQKRQNKKLNSILHNIFHRACATGKIKVHFEPDSSTIECFEAAWTSEDVEFVRMLLEREGWSYDI